MSCGHVLLYAACFVVVINFVVAKGDIHTRMHVFLCLLFAFSLVRSDRIVVGSCNGIRSHGRHIEAQDVQYSEQPKAYHIR